MRFPYVPVECFQVEVELADVGGFKGGGLNAIGSALPPSSALNVAGRAGVSETLSMPPE